jgi:hypothetical protein
MVAALLLMKPSASAGRNWKRGGGPVPVRQARSPIRHSPVEASAVRSPVPIAPVEGVRQHLQHRRVDPGATGADLVQPGHQHGPAQVGRLQGARAGRMAAQQPQAVLGQVILGQPHVPVRADPGGPAVHGPAGGHVPRGLPRGPRRRGRGRRDRDPGFVPGDRRDPGARQRRAVNHDARWAHPAAPVHVADQAGYVMS